MAIDRVLFFPVTPFTPDDEVDLDRFGDHLADRLTHRPGAVFAACGTGEFHTLSVDEHRRLAERAVAVTDGAVPVICGAGGPLGHARACARSAADAGADGLLAMPPYLVGAPQQGLVAYVEAIAAVSDLELVVYHRANAQLTPATVERLFANPKVVGVKDGVGDLAIAQQFVLAAAHAGRTGASFFNGLLTAELTQAAYDGIGVPYYSSAAFAMVPDVATAYLGALRRGDDELRHQLLEAFYLPLVALRDETRGFAVALIKAGVRLEGLDVGPVRPPLVDPDPEQLDRLRRIIDDGRKVLA
ncbi:MAG: 5-dehydro-4-deoxyglucarate dehydratase [Actinomycetota bacterium]|nr:5-dehydro-4-deoxyglucarate dehydratase [Actinomycetota bacterium]